MAVKLTEIGATEDLEQAEKNVLEAVDDMAARLGNTRDIARASYISPRVVDHYLEGSVVAYYGERLEEVIAAEQGGLTEGERALLELLNKKLRRESRRAA
jgi:DNA topoisomerase I